MQPDSTRSGGHDQAARRLADGSSFSPGEPYFRPPLYPMFLAALYKVFGVGLVAPRVIQMLLGVAQVWVCWRIASITHGVRVAKVAPMIMHALLHVPEHVATAIGGGGVGTEYYVSARV